MAGSWEIYKHRSVLAAILHVETTTVAWAFGLRNLQIPGPIIGLSGMPFDQSRNLACMKALEIGADHLFFVDSDVIPPNDAVLRLLAHDKPIISGMYSRRSPPHGVPVMIKNGSWVTQFPPNEIIEVDLVGAGCLLIRRDVLEKFEPQRPGHHWFDWRVDQVGNFPQGECLSEDFTFCLSAKRQGWPILVDCGIQCRHVGFSQATYGSLVPLESIPVT